MMVDLPYSRRFVRHGSVEEGLRRDDQEGVGRRLGVGEASVEVQVQRHRGGGEERPHSQLHSRDKEEVPDRLYADFEVAVAAVRPVDLVARRGAKHLHKEVGRGEHEDGDTVEDGV